MYLVPTQFILEIHRRYTYDQAEGMLNSKSFTRYKKYTKIHGQVFEVAALIWVVERGFFPRRPLIRVDGRKRNDCITNLQERTCSPRQLKQYNTRLARYKRQAEIIAEIAEAANIRQWMHDLAHGLI